MSARRQLHFEWDSAKALSNERKHGVSFSLALSIFRDPRIQTMFDEEHSGSEERWIAPWSSLERRASRDRAHVGRGGPGECESAYRLRTEGERSRRGGL